MGDYVFLTFKLIYIFHIQITSIIILVAGPWSLMEHPVDKHYDMHMHTTYVLCEIIILGSYNESSPLLLFHFNAIDWKSVRVANFFPVTDNAFNRCVMKFSNDCLPLSLMLNFEIGSFPHSWMVHNHVKVCRYQGYNHAPFSIFLCA